MYNDILHFMEFGVDTLYSYENHGKKPHAILNAGSFKFPPDPMLDEVLKLNGKVWVDNILESNKSLFIKTYSSLVPLTSTYSVFDKSTSIITILKDNGFINDIDGGISFWPERIVDTDMMIGFADAFDMIKLYRDKKPVENKTQSSQLEYVIKNLTETSNPVLIIVR